MQCSPMTLQDYETAVAALLNGRPDGASSHDLFHGVSDDVWRWLNTTGYECSPAARDLLPPMPDPAVQQRVNGSAAVAALVEAYDVYAKVKALYERHRGTLHAGCRVLDFGSGWGRMTRLFVRDVAPQNLWGFEYSPHLVEFCQQNGSWAQFRKTEPFPPSPARNDSFDLILGYSVFTHFSELAHDAWLRELHRVAEHGALVMLTVRARRFIRYCGRPSPGPRVGSRQTAGTCQDVP